MISVCFRASSWTWTATALWRRVWWRKAKRCSSSSPPTNQVPSLFLPHTHTSGYTLEHTHRWPYRSHNSVPFIINIWINRATFRGENSYECSPERETERDKDKETRRREGEIEEEEEEEREEEEPAGWKWLTGGEVSQSYFRFSQNICSPTERERAGEITVWVKIYFPFCNLMEIFRFGL